MESSRNRLRIYLINDKADGIEDKLEARPGYDLC